MNSSSRFDSDLPAWKRSIDIVCCLIALPFLAILTLLMSVVMKMVAPGPVFFRQERIGRNGRTFRIYKFRSMYVNSDTRAHQKYLRHLIHTNAPMAKLDTKNDARLIPGCWLLRAAGLDELPQIINVLRGEMSIVGPRPCIPTEYAAYQPWQRQRCEITPGLTGLWQVTLKNRSTFDEMVHLDISYGQARSWALDMKIIFRTVPALVEQVCETRRGRRANAEAQAPIPQFSLPNQQSSLPLN